MGTAFVPIMLHFFHTFTLTALSVTGLAYIVAEKMRMSGREVPLISDITAAAARRRDENKFVLGPVTLVTGIDAGAPRLPLTPMTEGAFEKMKGILKAGGLI